jgi:hypothetical protein
MMHDQFVRGKSIWRGSDSSVPPIDFRLMSSMRSVSGRLLLEENTKHCTHSRPTLNRRPTVTQHNKQPVPKNNTVRVSCTINTETSNKVLEKTTNRNAIMSSSNLPAAAPGTPLQNQTSDEQSWKEFLNDSGFKNMLIDWNNALAIQTAQDKIVGTLRANPSSASRSRSYSRDPWPKKSKVEDGASGDIADANNDLLIAEGAHVMGIFLWLERRQGRKSGQQYLQSMAGNASSTDGNARLAGFCILRRLNNGHRIPIFFA